MESVKKWLLGRKRVGLGAVVVEPGRESASINTQEHVKSDYELTCIEIKDFLENRHYLKVVDLLNELPSDYVINCLESFPFILLNKAVPASFIVWETLLAKLQSSEEDYTLQFPYKSCDQLVMRVAWYLEAHKQARTEGICRRVLKCVYAQYKEILEQLHKEHDHVDHALHTLGLHAPLGPGGLCSIVSIRQAIEEEVQASLEDYTSALDSLNGFEQRNDHKINTGSDKGEEVHRFSPGGGGVVRHEGGSGRMDQVVGSELARKKDAVPTCNSTQLQLHEKLHRNRRVFTALQKSRGTHTFPQAVDFLKEQIHRDKAVINLIKKIQAGDATEDIYVPLQPWLLRYQHALDLTITVLKDIDQDTETSVLRVASLTQLREVTESEDDEEIKRISVLSGKSRRKSIDDKRLYHRHSAAPILEVSTRKEVKNHVSRGIYVPRRNLSVPHAQRLYSASPQKCLHVNGQVMPAHSISTGSSTSNLAMGISSSAVELHKNSDYSLSLPFNRVQSLKPCNSVQLEADQKNQDMSLLPNSFTNLTSISTGCVNTHHLRGKKSRRKNLHGSSSELVQAWDMQYQVNNNSMCDGEKVLQQVLKSKDEELTAVLKLVQELRKRDKELTERLAEQAQQHLQDCEKFEDILLGNNRPTQVVQSFNELYSQGRVEALDALETTAAAAASLRHASNSNSNACSVDAGFSTLLLLDVLTLSYKEVTKALEQLHEDWKAALCVDAYAAEEGGAVRQLESAVALYLCKVGSKHNTSTVTENVWEQLTLKYAGSKVYRKACGTPAFSGYVRECVRMSWKLCVQTPPMTLSYSETEFNLDLHTRFFESDRSSSSVHCHHWPALIHTSSGSILARGIVQT